MDEKEKQVRDVAWKIADTEVGWDDETEEKCQKRFESELIRISAHQAREDAIQDIESVKNEYFNHLLNREGFDRTEKEIGIVEGIDKCLAKLKELKKQGEP